MWQDRAGNNTARLGKKEHGREGRMWQDKKGNTTARYDRKEHGRAGKSVAR